ncbi:putative linoleate 9S-lipoxygenase 5 [Hibiscus syriacus]|uniref:Linoleate 9S-lipoxygenase 5 n=1 Tax=Hibiscus syriacus TaxID=106335 RepID=A0A6A3AQN7_HIBSY|nr:putative linoleate 9S-lipoxygenase 5 [Hibiscus syriacus]
MPYFRKINSTSTKIYASRTVLLVRDDGTLKPLEIELSLLDLKGDRYSAVCEVYTPAHNGAEVYKDWNLLDQALPSYLKKRNDEMVQDSELQAWWKEDREEGHGDKKEEPWWPKMQTREDLIQSWTIIIWLSSAVHSATNFSQYPYAGYAPNRPTITRRFIPEKDTPEYAELESNPDKASDETVLTAFKEFGNRLSGIEERIVQRNNDKRLKNRIGPVNVPYTLFYPTSDAGITGRGIPNSLRSIIVTTIAAEVEEDANGAAELAKGTSSGTCFTRVFAEFDATCGKFGYIATIIVGCKLEHVLISALIERWRPETHTFHLPCGEAIITLEDVSMHLGLPVDGNMMCGMADGDWKSMCIDYLGAAPPEFNEGRITLSWLKANFEVLNENASEDQAKACARAYILRIIGGILMPDKSRNQVHCMWLRHLIDFDEAGRYSWGAAVLAFLFREMCRATNYKKTAIGGCLLLLQSWAWFRMPFLCPIVNEPYVFPLLLRLEEIRLLIDTKAGSEFQWIPYASDEVKACIPPHLSGSLEVWISVIPLICYAIIEWHPVDRVLRQYGCTQYIPGAPRNLDNVHNIDRRGKKDVNWVVRHRDWIALWENRYTLLAPRQYYAETGHMVTDNYMNWFNENGKPFLLSAEARGVNIPRRRERRQPSQYHRPPTRGRREGATGSASVPPQHPYPSMPQGYMPSPPLYMPSPPVYMPSPQGYIPSPQGYIPSPPGYMPSPQGFIPYGGAYTTMFNDPAYGSYASYLAGGASPQTPQSPSGSQTSMPIFPQFSQFPGSGGIVTSTPPGSLFYTGPSASSTPNEETAADNDSEDEETEEQVPRRNPPRNRQPPPCGTHSRRRHR